MPLIKGHGPEIISQNIAELRRAGKPERQAIAIAMKHANKFKPKAKKSEGEPDATVLKDF
jgi:hypothetical protein